jgi:hypothetical protein
MRPGMKAISMIAAFACLGVAAPGSAQDDEGGSFIYATYYYCDVTQQERVDEIVGNLDKPIYDAAVDDGTILAWGWLVHHTGGKWRRAQYHRAPSLAALLASQEKIGDAIDAKNKKMAMEGGKICNAHDDYIWRSMAGNEGTRSRGKVSFSVYHICDVARESQADAIVKTVYAPIYDRMVAEGKLVSWGWAEHIVGGEYRRLATMTAGDIPALLQARTAVVAAIDEAPLTATFDAICGPHADYMWEIKFEKP